MSNDPTHDMSRPAADELSADEHAEERRDAAVRPGADRAPTAEEERAAERAANDVDLERVEEHYTEMQDIGVNVRGEGEIPD